MDTILVVRPIGRWAEPKIIIQLRRWLAIGNTVGLAFSAPVHAGQADFHRPYLAQTTGPDVFASSAEFCVGALLAAGLENALVFAHSRNQCLAFRNEERLGLLAINILPGLTRMNSGKRVP